MNTEYMHSFGGAWVQPSENPFNPAFQPSFHAGLLAAIPGALPQSQLSIFPTRVRRQLTKETGSEDA